MVRKLLIGRRSLGTVGITFDWCDAKADIAEDFSFLVLIHNVSYLFFFLNFLSTYHCSWLKRNEIVLAGSNSEERLQILCDPGWSFMTTYEIVGDSIDRQWSMTMLAFDTKGDLIRLDRDVEPSRCGDLVASVMKDVGASS